MKQLTLILIIIPTILFSQAWEKTYDNNNYNDFGQSVQQTTDDGYIIAGTTESLEYGTRNTYIIKTDYSGNTLWTKTFGNDSGGYSVKQTIDGGYIIAGRIKSSNNGDKQAYLVKTDNNGDTIWTSEIGGESYEVAYSVQQTLDDGYIITGSTSSFGNGSSYVYIVKIHNNGDTLWTKAYGGENSDYGNSIQHTNDGGYIITGSTSSFGNGYSDVYVLKTDNNGDTLWTRTYGGEKTDFGNSIQQTNDGGYIIAGVTNSFTGNWVKEMYLIRTDNTGDTLWTKTFGHGSGGSSVKQTNDGGYIIAGYTLYGNEYSFVKLIKTDSNGDILWEKTFGNKDTESGGWSVQQTNDGGYIIAGTTSKIIQYKNYNFYLIKTDGNGNISFTSENPYSNKDRKVVKMIDIAGREINKPLKNELYIEIYNDGTTQKKMMIR